MIMMRISMEMMMMMIWMDNMETCAARNIERSGGREAEARGSALVEALGGNSEVMEALAVNSEVMEAFGGISEV